MTEPGEASGSKTRRAAAPAGEPQAVEEPGESGLESAETASAAVELGPPAETVVENLLWNYGL